MKGWVIQKTSGYEAGIGRRRSYKDSCVRYNDEWCNEVCTPFVDGFSKIDESDFMIFNLARDRVKKISFIQPLHIFIDDLQIFIRVRSLYFELSFFHDLT